MSLCLGTEESSLTSSHGCLSVSFTEGLGLTPLLSTHIRTMRGSYTSICCATSQNTSLVRCTTHWFSSGLPSMEDEDAVMPHLLRYSTMECSPILNLNLLGIASDAQATPTTRPSPSGS
jgi:hypothetical protein